MEMANQINRIGLADSRFQLSFCHIRPQLTNSTYLNSASADECGPLVALQSLTRQPTRPPVHPPIQTLKVNINQFKPFFNHIFGHLAIVNNL